MAIGANTMPSKPQFGRRLLPTIVDQIARTQPEREMLSVPRSDKASDGWRPITFGQFADAVNRVAALLIERHHTPQQKTNGAALADPVSKSSEDYLTRFPTVAYIGPSDVRYPVFVIAAIKAGCKPLFVSPRNTPEAQLNLFNKTECDIMYYDASFEERVPSWIDARPGMKGFKAGSAAEWLGEDGGHKAPLVPYDRTFDEARWDPVLVLHTSGSTGLPKPVVLRAGAYAVTDLSQVVPDFRGSPSLLYTSILGTRLFAPMPLFHAAGIFLTLTCSIYYGQPVALGIHQRPLTPQALIDAVEHAEIETTLLPPAILEEMSHMPEGIAALKKLKRACFGGGPLSHDTGNALVKAGVKVTSFIGATEIMPIYYYVQPQPELWEWFLIDSEAQSIEWRPFSENEDGTVYEQVIIRQDPKDAGTQSPFYIFPETTEYSTKDLYIKHPTLPDLWKHFGRSDDVIVFSNGEKLNPTTIEAAVTSQPEVKGAVVVGQGRFQAALLIEPSAPISEEKHGAFIDSLWPAVERANKETVTHGRIARQLVALTRPDKPFPRAGKSTIQRHAAVKLYADEIAALYEQAGLDDDAGGDGKDDSVALDVSSEEALANSIVEVFTRVADLEAKGKKLDVGTDLFTFGVDSLQVISSSRILRRGLESATGHKVPTDALAPRFIYANPTAQQLASYLMREVVAAKQNGHANGDSNHANGVNPAIAVMQSQLDKYTKNLPDAAAQRQKPAPRSRDQTVIVTGSTGGLGSYLLDMLQASPSVAKVICLNRTEDAAERQAQSSAEKGLDTSFSKAEFLCADLSQPKLGLTPETYDRLLAETDTVVHNAWPVNFNMSIATFEPSVRGVRHLIDLSAQCARRVPITFVSSIGTLETWAGPAPVPESKLEDMSLPVMGYGQSKLVASLILDEARARAGIPSAIVRVGQIAGPRAQKGEWTRREWLPTLVRSSLHLGLLPADLGAMNDVDWTPVEDMAALVLEVANVLPRGKGWSPSAESESGDAVEGYFHGVNPNTTSWDSLAKAVQKAYGQDRIKRLVPLGEWSKALEQSVADTRTDEDVTKNPGVKLLDFYQALSGAQGRQYELKRTVGVSPTFAALEALTPDLMENWCRQWGF